MLVDHIESLIEQNDLSLECITFSLNAFVSSIIKGAAPRTSPCLLAETVIQWTIWTFAQRIACALVYNWNGFWVGDIKSTHIVGERWLIAKWLFPNGCFLVLIEASPVLWWRAAVTRNGWAWMPQRWVLVTPKKSIAPICPVVHIVTDVVQVVGWLGTRWIFAVLNLAVAAQTHSRATHEVTAGCLARCFKQICHFLTDWLFRVSE